MTEENTGGLSAAETAYFESGGTAEITVEPVQTEPQTQEPVVAEPVVEPELAADGQPRGKDGKFAKTIPFDVFHAEREEHKRTKAVLEEIKTKQAVLEDRWNTILKAGEPKAADEDPEPDPNVDIFAHNAWLRRRQEKLETRISERDQQEQQTRQAQEQDAAIWNVWQQETTQFAQTQTDFEEARNFLSTMRETQLKGLGRVNPQFATEQGRIQQINSELKEIIVASKQQGISPAQFIYELASAYGYTPKQAQEAAAAANPTGELPDSLKRIAAAQDASRTVGGASGGAGGDPLTPEAIANMSAKEFEGWMKTPENAARFQKIMGG